MSPNLEDSPRGARRGSRLVLVALFAATTLAGCFGRGRGTTPGRPGAGVPGATPPAVPVTAADSARRDSTVRDSIGRDSVARGGRGVTARDSAARDSIARDSAARLSADTADATRRRPATPARATRQCILDLSESPPETRITYSNIPGASNTYIGGGFVGHCQGENNRIRADSAEQFQGSGIVNLFGNVFYEEPNKMRIQASRATYFTREQRLNADGGVVATQLETGSTFEGPSIEYLRPLAGVRAASRLIAPGRPTATLIERDVTGLARPPVRIVANTMVDEGDSLLYAWGQVVITRTNLTGEADSGSYDKIRERSRLIRQARVVNTDGNRSFRLVGDTIDLYNRDRVIDRVVALHKASATNQDLVMNSERLDLRLVDQRIDRAFASGDGRSTATTPQQELSADSIMVHLPAQRVREVRAIGGAVTTGKPDTLRIRSDDRDVLRGDTVTALFDTTRVPGDTSSQPKLRQILAVGNASSLFQVASREGPAAPPAINYMRGERIDVAFDTGAVRTVNVDSSASGIYLEPEPDSLADSARLVTPDSVRRDSIRADSVRRDSVRRDSVRRDSIARVSPRPRRDTIEARTAGKPGAGGAGASRAPGPHVPFPDVPMVPASAAFAPAPGASSSRRRP